MELHNLKPTPGSTHSKKRVGRGIGSGTGKTAGTGHKGQNSRSGRGTRLGFEGGQTPFFKSIYKNKIKTSNLFTLLFRKRGWFLTLNLKVCLCSFLEL